MVPLSLLVALVIIHQLDVSINVFSLGGLALGVGLLVDNAIVVAEAANRRRDETGEPWHLAAIRATDQVAGPLIAATLTTMMVFGPIIFVKGLTSTLFRDLSLSVVTSVGASLLLALTLMPVMIARRTDGTKRKPAPTASTRLSHIGGRMANLYERGVFAALDHPRRVLGTTAAVTGAAVWVAIALPKEILPPVDERLLVGALRLPEGTSLHETIRQVQRLEWAAAELGARRVYARVGLATDEEVLSGVDPGSSSTAHVIIPAPHGFTAEELAQRLRQRLPDLVRGSLAFDVAGQSEFGSLVGREGRLVKVEVSARTAAASQHAAEQVRVAIARLPGLTDVRNAFATTQPVLEVEYERERLAERGISLSAVSSAVSSALGGTAATELLEADRRTPVRVHYIGAASENLAAALQTTVAGVPVGQLVRITEARAPVEVVRIGQRPVTVVEALIVRGGTARATDVVRDALGHVRLDPE
jgi:HAE1 family hydrophobic/amphiphilic exporter-1